MVLAEEIGTKDKWAIKFLERGNKITKVWRSKKLFFFGCFSVMWLSFFSFSFPSAALSFAALFLFMWCRHKREYYLGSGMEIGEEEQ